MIQKLSPLPPRKRVSLGEQVYESLREAIVTLTLEPGQMIYENELSAELGVSRTPVREAIRLLVSEELLEVLPQRGTRVTLISVQKVTEARFIRELLEHGAFRLVASAWNDEMDQILKEQLLDLLEQQRIAAAAEDNSEFLALDEAFHRVILEAAGNKTLIQTIYAMRGHLNRVRYLALTQYHHMKPLIAEHEALLQALTQHQETRLPELLELHFSKLDSQLPMLKDAHPDYFQD